MLHTIASCDSECTSSFTLSVAPVVVALWVVSLVWLFSMCNPNHANGTIRYLAVLLNLVDHEDTVHLVHDHTTSTTNRPKLQEKLIYGQCIFQFKINSPSTYSHNSMNFYHCHDCMSKMDCYLIHTMDRLRNHRHYHRNHRSLICSSRFPNEFWSVNIGRIYTANENECRLINKIPKCHTASIPFISFEIFQFNSQRIVFIIGEHVNVFIAQPEFFGWIAETIFVISPVSIEILSWFTEIVSSLNDLEKMFFTRNSMIHLDFAKLPSSHHPQFLVHRTLSRTSMLCLWFVNNTLRNVSCQRFADQCMKIPKIRIKTKLAIAFERWNLLTFTSL